MTLDTSDPLEFVFYGDFGEVGAWLSSSWWSGTPGGRCMPCAPGTIINLDAAIGPGELNGREFAYGYWDTNGGGLSDATEIYWDGFLRFDTGGATVVAAAGWNPDPLAAFVFTGELIGYLDAARTGSPVFQSSLFGHGTVRLSLEPFPHNNPTALFMTSNQYWFDAAQNPVPEPATMLLAGAGLAYIGRRAARRRRTRGAAA